MKYEEQVDHTGKEYALSIKMKGSHSKLIIGGEYLGLDLNLICDHNAADSTKIYETTWFKTFQGMETITAKSKGGCPVFELNRFFAYMKIIKIPLMILMIASGLVVGIKGR